MAAQQHSKWKFKVKPIVCCWVSCCTHITLQWWCDGCVFMPKQLPILNYHMPKRQLAEGRKRTIVAVGRCGGMKKVVLMRFLLKYMRLRWSESALRRAGRKKQGRKLRQVRNLANKLNTQQQQYTERVGSFRHMKIPSHGRSLALFSLCNFSSTFHFHCGESNLWHQKFDLLRNFALKMPRRNKGKHWEKLRYHQWYSSSQHHHQQQQRMQRVVVISDKRTHQVSKWTSYDNDFTLVPFTFCPLSECLSPQSDGRRRLSSKWWTHHTICWIERIKDWNMFPPTILCFHYLF